MKRVKMGSAVIISFLMAFQFLPLGFAEGLMPPTTNTPAATDVATADVPNAGTLPVGAPDAALSPVPDASDAPNAAPSPADTPDATLSPVRDNPNTAAQDALDATLLATADALTPAAPPVEQFQFEVTVGTTGFGDGSLDFAVPTSGVLNPGGGGELFGKQFAWNISWGDSTNGSYNDTDSPNADDATGINHTYPAAGTYTVTITPAGSHDA